MGVIKRKTNKPQKGAERGVEDLSERLLLKQLPSRSAREDGEDAAEEEEVSGVDWDEDEGTDGEAGEGAEQRQEDADDEEKESEEQEALGEEGRGELGPGSSGVARDGGVKKKEGKKNDKKKEKLRAMLETHKKRGVCYLSRIPPHMKPLKLRHLLSQYAEVLRVYLAPEDSAVRLRRKKAGGNRGKNFTEGWVEFAKKKDAKRVAAVLNGEPIGGGKRNAYHYDLWTIKYLSKFKWDNLTEEIAYKNAVREQKLAFEISAATKERDFYLAKVDQSRAIKAMADRKRKRSEAGAVGGAEEDGVQEGGGDGGTGVAPREKQSVAGGGVPAVKAEAAGRAGEGANQLRRRFRQRQGVADPVTADEPRLARDVLAKVF